MQRQTGTGVGGLLFEQGNSTKRRRVNNQQLMEWIPEFVYDEV